MRSSRIIEDDYKVNAYIWCPKCHCESSFINFSGDKKKAFYHCQYCHTPSVKNIEDVLRKVDGNKDSEVEKQYINLIK